MRQPTGQLTDQERHAAQPEERHRGHSHRRADRRDRRGRLRQEHADQRRLPGAAPGRDRDRPVARDGATAARPRPPTPASWTTSGKAFAKANKVSASLFSFNSDGQLAPTATAWAWSTPTWPSWRASSTTCEICEGKRFKPEVLAYHLRGKTISDVLDMTVEEAAGLLHREEDQGACCRR